MQNNMVDEIKRCIASMSDSSKLSVLSKTINTNDIIFKEIENSSLPDTLSEILTNNKSTFDKVSNTSNTNNNDADLDIDTIVDDKDTKKDDQSLNELNNEKSKVKIRNGLLILNQIKKEYDKKFYNKIFNWKKSKLWHINKLRSENRKNYLYSKIDYILNYYYFYKLENDSNYKDAEKSIENKKNIELVLDKYCLKRSIEIYKFDINRPYFDDKTKELIITPSIHDYFYEICSLSCEDYYYYDEFLVSNYNQYSKHIMSKSAKRKNKRKRRNYY